MSDLLRILVDHVHFGFAVLPFVVADIRSKSSEPYPLFLPNLFSNSVLHVFTIEVSRYLRQFYGLTLCCLWLLLPYRCRLDLEDRWFHNVIIVPSEWVGHEYFVFRLLMFWFMHIFSW